MPMHVKVSGVWKEVSKLHTKVSGVWKEVESGYVKVSGAWKEFLASEKVILSGTSGSPNVDVDFAISPDDAFAGWSFNASGDLTKISGTAHNKPEWFGKEGDTTHKTPDQTYYLRATLESGDAPDSGTLNTWLSLASGRFFRWDATGGFELSAGTLKIEIATDAAGTDIVDTGYYRGSAQTEF